LASVSPNKVAFVLIDFDGILNLALPTTLVDLPLITGDYNGSTFYTLGENIVLFDVLFYF
jgi:hypothetical protein